MMMKPRRTRPVFLLILVAALGLWWFRGPVQAWAWGVDGGPALGKVAPELPLLKTVRGPTVRLAELRGQVVLLHFWTFGCSNCKHMVPRYVEWDERFRARGLRVVGVHTPELSFERDLDKLRSFIDANRIAWPVVLDPDEQAWNTFGIKAWPTTILIDRAGVVRATFIGDNRASDIEAALQRLL